MNMKAKNISQGDIANKAGVSISTVSRALSDAEGISPQIRENILNIADELGYRRKGLKTQSLNHIGLFTAYAEGKRDISSEFNYGILTGVEAECQRQNLQFSFVAMDPNLDSKEIKKTMLERIQSQGIDGVLLLRLDSPEVIKVVKKLDYPAGVINGEMTTPQLDLYLPDNWGGPQLVMEHLISKGHKRILHLTELKRNTIKKRFDAYKVALQHAGIDYDPELVIDTKMVVEDSYLAMKEYLKKDVDFTAVFCANDVAAVSVIRALNESGKNVPADVSVVGYDDLGVSEIYNPPITTIHVNCNALGVQAVRGLMARRNNPDGPAIRYELAVELVERKSVALLK
ncbi:MAG TPA: LacI family transcriptional regulator [Trueperaceae bacterium]|nr:LacI family transcriptional regulator [Trueperaceae bacterium]